MQKKIINESLSRVEKVKIRSILSELIHKSGDLGEKFSASLADVRPAILQLQAPESLSVVAQFILSYQSSVEGYQRSKGDDPTQSVDQHSVFQVILDIGKRLEGHQRKELDQWLVRHSKNRFGGRLSCEQLQIYLDFVQDTKRRDQLVEQFLLSNLYYPEEIHAWSALIQERSEILSGLSDANRFANLTAFVAVFQDGCQTGSDEVYTGLGTAFQKLNDPKLQMDLCQRIHHIGEADLKSLHSEEWSMESIRFLTTAPLWLTRQIPESEQQHDLLMYGMFNQQIYRSVGALYPQAAEFLQDCWQYQFQQLGELLPEYEFRQMSNALNLFDGRDWDKLHEINLADIALKISEQQSGNLIDQIMSYGVRIVKTYDQCRDFPRGQEAWRVCCQELLPLGASLDDMIGLMNNFDFQYKMRISASDTLGMRIKATIAKAVAAKENPLVALGQKRFVNVEGGLSMTRHRKIDWGADGPPPGMNFLNDTSLLKITHMADFLAAVHDLPADLLFRYLAEMAADRALAEPIDHDRFYRRIVQPLEMTIGDLKYRNCDVVKELDAHVGHLVALRAKDNRRSMVYKIVGQFNKLEVALPRMNRLMSQMGPSFLLLEDVISETNLRLCEQWYGVRFLRHNQFSLLVFRQLFDQLKKGSYAGDREDQFVKKLLKLIEVYGKTDSRRITEVLSTILVYEALYKQWPDLTVDDQDLEKSQEALRKDIISGFVNEHRIPEEVFEKSPLPASEIEQAIIHYSYLAKTIRSYPELQTEFRYMVIVDLLNLTPELKKGNFADEALSQFFSPREIDHIRGIRWSDFPLLDNSSAMECWVREDQQRIQLDAKTLTPQEQVTEIIQRVNATIQHLSPEFKKKMQDYVLATGDNRARRGEIKKKMAGLGRALAQAPSAAAMVAQAVPAVVEQFPETKGMSVEEAKKIVEHEQRLTTLFDGLQDLKRKVPEELNDFLGLMESNMNTLLKEKPLLDLIQYRMPESPGIYLWTEEVETLQDKLLQPEVRKLIENHKLEDRRQVLLGHIKEWNDLIRDVHKYLEKLKEKSEKVSHQLVETASENEAGTQVLNIKHCIDDAKSARSELLTVSDLTHVRGILKALKEDNHCLSPDSNVNGHTNLSFLDPNRKLIIVRNKEGRLKANVILTIGWINDNPGLLIDNIYSTGNSSTYFEIILRYIQQRFRVMDVPLFAFNGTHGRKDVKDQSALKNAEVRLPEPQHGPAYFEAGHNWSAFSHGVTINQTGYVYKLDDESSFAPNPLNKIDVGEVEQLLAGVAYDSFNIMPVENSTDSIDIEVEGPQGIVLNLNRVRRRDDSYALEMGVEIMDRVKAPKYPGQRRRGASPFVIRTLFNNIKRFAKLEGYSCLLADPEYYHTYRLLKQAGFELDPQAQHFGYYQEMLTSLEEGFQSLNIKGALHRSQLIKAGKVRLAEDDQLFVWPTEENQIFMIYPL